jgi:DNA-binding HxlR family transcriptional regulator
MQHGYDQFCPIAKAAEVVATRWTPLILRELMANNRTFNDIHRGMPLISKAVLKRDWVRLNRFGIPESASF